MAKFDKNIDPVTLLDYSVVRRCSAPSYETLLRIVHDDRSIQHITDISLLLHERDIQARFGLDSFSSILSEFSPRGGSLLNSYRNKYSDEELMNSVKPRNIQTPSELRLWFKYLNATMDVEKQLKENENEKENDSSSSDDHGVLYGSSSPVTE